MNYTVDDAFAVRVFNDGQDVPFLFQPEYPNGDKFDSREEAAAWAEACIASHASSDAPYPPNGKGLSGEPQPTKEEFDAIMAQLRPHTASASTQS